MRYKVHYKYKTGNIPRKKERKKDTTTTTKHQGKNEIQAELQT